MVGRPCVVTLGGMGLLAGDALALDGLQDFLAGGGTIYLAIEALPLFNALVGDERIALHPFASIEQTVVAELVEPNLEVELDWSTVGVPVAAGRPIPLVTGGPVRVLAEAELEDSEGSLVASPLALEVDVGPGQLTLVNLPASAPHVDDWWRGSPAEWTRPDGFWDGRGALLDRILLRL